MAPRDILTLSESTWPAPANSPFMDPKPFEIFVDGGCSMCSRESRFMKRLDRERGRLVVTEIADLDFDRLGVTWDDAMRSIHGRTPEGRVIHGPEVFRRAYAAVGLGWLWAWTGWPVVRPIVDRVYAVFAGWRYRRRMRQGCRMPESRTA